MESTTEGKKKKKGRSELEISTTMASSARLNSTVTADLNGNSLGREKNKKTKKESDREKKKIEKAHRK